MDTLKAFIEEKFSEENLLIVSNREPYIHKKVDSFMKVEKPAGGLTTAMDAVLKATGGTWVAWGSGSGDKEVVDGRDRVKVPPDNPSYSLKRVWLTQNIVENYYHGYSNQVLWPLCHITLDRVYFRKRFWEDYKFANLLFAEAVLDEARDDSTVWVHDYHLCLVPRILRERKPKLTIAHFWHIPWPDWNVFRACPQWKEILDGLLGNDLIGFQIPLFVKSFMECVKERLDAEIDYKHATIRYKGHLTRLKAFPISIDYERFNSMASSWHASRVMENIKKRYGLSQCQIGIGVDRLEYTKALIKRLQAINLFFERYERYRGKFTFIQIAVPTRMKEPYISYKKAVEELTTKINRRYSTDKWKPIVYISIKVEHRDLVAYYRMADVAVISSVYDGMNLVAKEYVASQTDENGVLILSELAGAAEELEGAILVNPYDIEGFSTCIKEALVMERKKKTGRMASLRQQVKKNNIYKWISDFLVQVLNISSAKQWKCQYLFDHISAVEDMVKNKKIFLLLDYDGTLTPIVDSPGKAVLSDNVRLLLLKLKERIPVAIISGRSLKDIKEKIGIDEIIYTGNHGAEIWDQGKIAVNQESEVNSRALKEFITRLENAVSDIPGIMIENKGITASLHFRNVHTKYIEELFSKYRKIAKDYEDIFQTTSGKKVLEVKPLNIWNKGYAVSWIMENRGYGSVPIYIGDDTTDESAFNAVKDKGISISVNRSPEAMYYFNNQNEVPLFLKWLLDRI